MSEMTVAEVLIGAVNALTERGHCRFTLEETDGKVCAVGALRYAAFQDPNLLDYYSPNADAYARAVMLMNKAVPGASIPRWNDADSTSTEDVILTMKRVAYENE